MKKLFVMLMIFATAMIASAENASDILAQLNKIQSYSADFIQKTEIQGFGSDTYSGKLYIKSRNRAMWDYSRPYRQFYLFDQSVMRFYDSENKQLIIQRLDPSTNAYMRLMMNPSDIRKDFRADYSSATGKLMLSPANPSSGINSMVFTVKDGMITGITTKDQNGNNTSIMFTNIKTNPDLPDSIFSPSVPKDTEVFKR